jgi:hypothetical protein
VPQLIFPKYVLDDLKNLISENYYMFLPHPLLIAQAFCLKFKEYGTDFRVYAIANAVEYVRNPKH